MKKYYQTPVMRPHKLRVRALMAGSPTPVQQTKTNTRTNDYSPSAADGPSFLSSPSDFDLD